MTDRPDSERMRLRYAGACRSCGAAVDAGQQAIYFRAAKQIECLGCAHPLDPGPAVADADSNEPRKTRVDTGTAGASARREYERRVAKREQRIRAAHPKLGGLMLALSDEPQSTRAWDRGARGEELLAKRLDGLGTHGVLLLHDRRIPGTRANIDHIAVSTAGVFVIDAKRYKGRPTLKIEGGLFRPRTEKLLVGGRDCTKLVDGVLRQVSLVREALAEAAGFGHVPVYGMLCFVEADWPLIGGAFSARNVQVLWPGKASEKITADGPLTADIAVTIQRRLASAFPIA